MGKWILKLLQGFFDAGSGSSEPEDLTGKGKLLMSFAIVILMECYMLIFLFNSHFDHLGKTSKATKNKGTKRYVPQRNSVAYALLITLHR